MSFPPDFLDQIRLHRPIAEVVGRKVRLVRRGREHTGLCPFHNEKTPSFTVSEEKGFYHCFGCGAHGDVITFMMETEGLSFLEAVERLAGESGLSMPQQTPQDRQQEAKRKTVYDVMEAAAGWFESQLSSAAGAGARGYLERRVVDPQTAGIFRIGFAPQSRSALKAAMLARDVTEEQLIEGGLLIKPEDGGESYDRFRDRLMFPIMDRQGRVVAFGGRALGDAKAKYLNSPETILFQKGKLLFNLHNARQASRDADRVVVVEGYMDVIALSQAGFKESVAPLGTALTEDQLRALWRLTPEPILCFDGDSAGQRAAARAADRALPLLQPGYSLRFATLPAGQDPDDLIRAEGSEAMAAVLEQASPLIDQVWRMKTGRVLVDTPERRAALQANVEAMPQLIQDEKVRDFYRSELKRRLQHYFERRGYGGGRQRAPRRAATGGRQGGAPYIEAPSANLTRTPAMRAQALPGARDELLLLRLIVNHPHLLDRHIEDLGHASLISPELEVLRGAIIQLAARAHDSDTELDSTSLVDQLVQTGLDVSVRLVTGFDVLRGERYVLADATFEDAERGLTYLLRQNRLAELRRELSVASSKLHESTDSTDLARTRELQDQIRDLENVREEFGAGAASQVGS